MLLGGPEQHKAFYFGPSTAITDTPGPAPEASLLEQRIDLVVEQFHQALRDTVRALPVERLLIETDSPWLAPVPFRGKPNEPRHVARVAECVADLKGLPVAELARVTRDNFYTLFSKAAS